MDINDLRLPAAVWKAVEGDTRDLVEFLRGDTPLNRAERDALADYFAGTLKPMKLPQGRSRKSNFYFVRGHDLTTSLGYAGYRYEYFRRYIRRKRWHLKRAGKLYWSTDRLRTKFAEKHGIDLDKFINYLNRAKPKRTSNKMPTLEEYRMQTVREIRRRKNEV